MAIEVYSPQTLPLRTIQADGSSPGECVEQLAERGLDPAKYEFQLLHSPY